MNTIFSVLIVITCVLLVLVVLVQNPKGGGLSATFGGGNQVMSSIYGDLMSCKNREVFSVTALRVTQNN